ncbi:5'-nucleotidase C-terminal domain-containing protein [Ammonicoccus fulvus]|uniref:5'-nucleotidase C-terminal domain-containing protein n=1 Tax=Ammonicoccus fulvus TaxID=3138240 RepID=A0ABZ3FIC2_9ACTN
MQIRRISGAALACTFALTAGPVLSAYAEPTADPTTEPTASVTATPTATATQSTEAAQPVASARAINAESCSTSPAQITVLNFNDFHGRIATASPDTVGFFGQIESYRAAAGEANSLVLSNGDNIGGSLFASFIQDDNPTIDILNAADLDATSVGNHEFDRGWDDLNGRVQTRADFPLLGANVYNAGTTTAALPEYAIFDKAGVKVAVIGAVTGDLPSLVSPAGISSLSIGDPVDAVNRVAAQLSDGNAANGEADVIIAEYHEGAAGSGDLATELAGSAIFSKIVNQTSPAVDAIFNAHSHQAYTFAAPVPGAAGETRPVVQSGSYASLIGKVELGLNADGEVECYTMANEAVTMTTADAVANYPRAAAIKTIVDATVAEAAVIGAQSVGNATAPIQRGLIVGSDGRVSDNRAVESTMTDLVAEMFRQQLGAGADDFIGVQNPGGTRADFDAGEITYAEAAAVLPFANTLMTTQLTGAQVKTMLEQQWQRTAAGEVPSRPYLQLGLSANVTYTYDESRAEGDRITSISVNGAPIDPAKLYTIGSGSFLIAGGDNFHVIADGTNTRDSGRVDLEAWVDFIKAEATVSPDYARQAVSVSSPLPTTIAVDTPVTLQVGVPQVGTPVAADTLDFFTGTVDNTEIVATLVTSAGEVQVGRAPVVDGRVEALTILVPAGTANGAAVLKLVASPSGTTVTLPVTITGGGTGTASPEPSTSPSTHPSTDPSGHPSTDPSGHPTKPGHPKPSHSNDPGKPVKPGHPNNPGKPVKPGHPNNPGYSNHPGKPNKPSSNSGVVKYPQKDRHGGLAKTGTNA